MLSFQQIGAIAEAVVGQEMKHSEVATRMHITEDQVAWALMVYRGQLPFYGAREMGKTAKACKKSCYIMVNGITYTYTSITNAATDLGVLPIKVAQFAKPTIISKPQKI